MIGKLRGLVDSQGPDHAIIDVGGVGYVVFCSPRTLRALPAAGQPASLAIETQMREDLIRLYGFASETERDWFRLLQGVQGVGSKVALAILGVLSPAELAGALASGDRTSVARAPGVGPKLAARIVAELKDKGPSSAEFGAFEVAAGASGAVPSGAEDALAALVNLGYARQQPAAAVAGAAAALGEGATTAELIRQGLTRLSA